MPDCSQSKVVQAYQRQQLDHLRRPCPGRPRWTLPPSPPRRCGACRPGTGAPAAGTAHPPAPTGTWRRPHRRPGRSHGRRCRAACRPAEPGSSTRSRLSLSRSLRPSLFVRKSESTRSAPRVLDRYALAQVRPGQGKVERDKRRGRPRSAGQRDPRTIRPVHSPWPRCPAIPRRPRRIRRRTRTTASLTRTGVMDRRPRWRRSPVRILPRAARRSAGIFGRSRRGHADAPRDVEAGPFGQGPDCAPGLGVAGRDACSRPPVIVLRTACPRLSPDRASGGGRAAARPR